MRVEVKVIVDYGSETKVENKRTSTPRHGRQNKCKIKKMNEEWKKMTDEEKKVYLNKEMDDYNRLNRKTTRQIMSNSNDKSLETTKHPLDRALENKRTFHRRK